MPGVLLLSIKISKK